MPLCHIFAGTAAVGRRSLPEDFERPSVVLSVPGALAVLLDCDMINTCCAVAECVRCVCVFLLFCIASDGEKARYYF